MVRKTKKLTHLEKAKIKYYKAENALSTLTINRTSELLGRAFASKSHTHSMYHYATNLKYFGINTKVQTLKITLHHEGGPNKNVLWASTEESELSIEDIEDSNKELKEVPLQELHNAFQQATEYQNYVHKPRRQTK